MLPVRIFIFCLFFIALVISVSNMQLTQLDGTYFSVLLIYLFFSFLFYHLRIISQKGGKTIDYGVNYTISFGIFAAPFGLFIFEFINRLVIYGYKKWSKTADAEEGIDFFYNVGAFVLQSSLAFVLYQKLIISFQWEHTIWYWVGMFVIVGIAGVVSDVLLILAFVLEKQMNSWKEAIDFIKTRSLTEMAKTSFSNGVLLHFLFEHNWTMIGGMFILNYLVSHSFLLKAQSIQDRIERDKFEQMAFTDYLTRTFNRAYMDKLIKELDNKRECLGIVVTDIDKFKSVNDSYNHVVGDRVIQHFAETIKANITESDILIRSGGEEFTIFLHAKSFEECKALVEHIRQVVEQSSVPVVFKDHPVSIHYTASFGLFYTENSYHQVENGYVLADNLLFQSKQLGRNRISIQQLQVSETSVNHTKDCAL